MRNSFLYYVFLISIIFTSCTKVTTGNIEDLQNQTATPTNLPSSPDSPTGPDLNKPGIPNNSSDNSEADGATHNSPETTDPAGATHNSPVTTDPAGAINTSPVTTAPDGAINTSLVTANPAGTPMPVVLVSPLRSPYYTSAKTITLSGSCQSENAVYLAGADNQTQWCVGNAFSFVLNKTDDGVYNYHLSQFNKNNMSSEAIAFSWILDSRVPSPLGIIVPAGTDIANNLNSLTISGSCEENAKVNLVGDAVAEKTCVNNSYSFSISKMTDGIFNFILSQTDFTGNTSAKTIIRWNRDTIVPQPPILIAPAKSNFVSGDSDLLIAGLCESSATVYLNGSNTDSILCNNLGQFSFTVSKNIDDTYKFTIKQIDRAGNVSPNLALQWRRLSTVPTTPTIIFPQVNPLTTNTNVLNMMVSCEPGDLVTLNLNADSKIDKECPVEEPFQVSFITSKTDDGKSEFSISQNNGVSTSADAKLVWILDRLVPQAPAILIPNEQNIINNNDSISIIGTCEVGAILKISGDMTATSICPSSGTFSLLSQKNEDRRFSFAVSQTDLAENFSGVSLVTWTRDTLAPAAPTLINPIDNPYTSRDSEILISGSCESGATVSISGDQVASTVCSNLGTYGFLINKDVDGTYIFELSQKDPAGNNSNLTTHFEWNRLSTLEITPTIVVPNKAIYSSNTKSLAITVQCTAGDNVNILGVQTNEILAPAEQVSQQCPLADPHQVIFTVAKTTDGTFSISFTQDNDGSFESAETSFEWIIDSVAPAAPLVKFPTNSPFVSPVALNLIGTCESNTKIYLMGDSIQTADCDASNEFAFIVKKAIDGVYNFSLKQKDIAGNISAASEFQWLKNSIALTPPTLKSPNGNPYLSNADNIILSGTCTEGASVSITGDISASDISDPQNSLNETCSANSNFSFTINKRFDGPFKIEIVQSLNGVDSMPTTFVWIRDTLTPQVSITNKSVLPSTNFAKTMTLTFVARNENAIYQCALDSGVFSSCVSPVELKLNSSQNGQHIWRVKAIDQAGNIGPEDSFTWTQAIYNTISLFHFDNPKNFLDSAFFSLNTNLSNNISGVNTSVGTGYIGQAANLGATSSLVVVHNSSQLFANAVLTFEAFIKPASFSMVKNQKMLIASKMGLAGNYGWEFGIMCVKSSGCTAKNQSFSLYLMATTSLSKTPTQYLSHSFSTLSTENFKHAAFTLSDGKIKFYFNGSSKGSRTLGGALAGSSANLQIGSSVGGANSFIGAIDEVRWSQIVRYNKSSYQIPTQTFRAD